MPLDERGWNDSAVSSPARSQILQANCTLTRHLPDQHEVLLPQNYDECLSVIESGARKRKPKSKINGYLSGPLPTQYVPQNMLSSLSEANIPRHGVRAPRPPRKLLSRASYSEPKLDAGSLLSDDELDVMEAGIRFFKYCRQIWHEIGGDFPDIASAADPNLTSETGRAQFDFDENCNQGQKKLRRNSNASTLKTIWEHMPPVPTGYMISDRQVQPGQPPAWGIFVDRAEPLPLPKPSKQEVTQLLRIEDARPSKTLTAFRSQRTESDQNPSSQKTASHTLAENIPPLPRRLTAPPHGPPMLSSGDITTNSAQIFNNAKHNQAKPSFAGRLHPSPPLGSNPRPPRWQFKPFDPAKVVQR